MKFPWQVCWSFFLCAAGILIVVPLRAEPSPDVSPAKMFFTPTNDSPLFLKGHTPVDFFRELLAMSAGEREHFLTNKPPEFRERLLAKIQEYEALNPNERELRLRATELRWYLMPLLRDSPTNRAEYLAHIPDDVRELVQTRLDQWMILPPSLKQEFLENERILHFFARVDMSNSPSENFGRGPSDTDRARWNALSEPERRQIAAGFNQFFELTPDEKQKTLNTLSETERHQMEKTLEAFDNMPATQRAECINAFAKFASMNAAEKAEFLKNAARWSAMSPAERQAWRDLVVNVPQWPPLPIGFVVPIATESHLDIVATNRN